MSIKDLSSGDLYNTYIHVEQCRKIFKKYISRNFFVQYVIGTIYCSDVFTWRGVGGYNHINNNYIARCILKHCYVGTRLIILFTKSSIRLKI